MFTKDPQIIFEDPNHLTCNHKNEILHKNVNIKMPFGDHHLFCCITRYELLENWVHQPHSCMLQLRHFPLSPVEGALSSPLTEHSWAPTASLLRLPSLTLAQIAINPTCWCCSLWFDWYLLHGYSDSLQAYRSLKCSVRQFRRYWWVFCSCFLPSASLSLSLGSLAGSSGVGCVSGEQHTRHYRAFHRLDCTQGAR